MEISPSKFNGDVLTDRHKDASSTLMFPNPATKEINVQIPISGQEAVLSIFCLSGKLISKQNFTGDQQIRKDVSTFSPGLYILELQYGNSRSQHKVVIQ
jgi:hypothetical protein